MAAAGSLALAGCGGGASFANKPRPAVPVNLTVYINDQRVSVSPARVGAGPVQLIVTNQASRNEAMTVVGSGSGTLADTGPINPGATAQVTVDFRTGDYLIATSRPIGSDAQRAAQAPIHPATLHIGPPRPSANNALLQP
jgi:hypothetical protein